MNEFLWGLTIEVIVFLARATGILVLLFVWSTMVVYKIIEYSIFWPIEKTIKRFG